MLNITSRGHYGLLAMVEMAAAYNGGFQHIQEIADKSRIPKNYLEQILYTLRKAGLITSLRGSNGGYRLSKPPSHIQALDIVEALERGTLPSITYGDNPLWKDFYNEAEQALKKPFRISLEKLEHLHQAKGKHTYYI